MVNVFIADKVDLRSCDLNTDFILNDSLFKAVILTTDSEADKYSYSEYGI